MKIADQADRKEMLQVRNKLAFILSLNRLIVGKHEQSWSQENVTRN